MPELRTQFTIQPTNITSQQPIRYWSFGDQLTETTVKGGKILAMCQPVIEGKIDCIAEFLKVNWTRELNN